MSLVRVHNFAVSLDGFSTGEGQSLEQPFGHAGTRLLDSFMGTRTFQTTLRQLLAEDLIDHMHIVIAPIVLGRGVRLWDGLEGLEDRFDIEVVSTPNGATHVTFTRR